MSERLNLLVIPDLFPTKGDPARGTFIVDYLKSVKQSCEISVLDINLVSPKDHFYLLDKTIRVFHCGVFRRKVKFLKPFFYLFFLRKGLRESKQFQQVDLIHGHGSVLSGLLSCLIAKRKKVPVVISVHSGPFSSIANHFLKRNIAKYALKRANLVLAVSEYLKVDIQKSNIHPKHFLVSGNPVDDTLFSPPSTPARKNAFLFAGRLDRAKGALRALKAFELFLERENGWEFWVAGDGEEMEDIKLYLDQKPKVRQVVRLLGKYTKDDLAKWMRAASFFVFPSEQETFGIVLTEAMASGLPVIAPNITAPAEFVREDCGFLVDPKQVDEIAKAMLTMAKENSFDRDQIADYAKTNFGLNAFGTQLMQFYTSLQEGK